MKLRKSENKKINLLKREIAKRPLNSCELGTSDREETAQRATDAAADS